MSAVQQARFLSETYGFNVIPMLSLMRDDEGKKIVKFENDYTKYRGERYNFDNWPYKSDNLAIITGKISNLTIVDIDSKEALKSLEDTTNLSIEELAEYIIKTSKGYQLFYSYEPTIKAKIGIRDFVDLLNDGRQTFADPTNDGYTVVKQDKPKAMPDKLKALFKEENTRITKSFLGSMQEENQLTYKNPLAHILEDYIATARVAKKLKAKLERRFCTNDYAGLTLEEASKPGRKHDFSVYVASICAVDPTVDEKLYYKFLYDFSTRTIKTTRSHDELNKVGGFDYVFDSRFDYNPKWHEKYEQQGSIQAVSAQADIKVWYDPEQDKYRLYDLKTKKKDTYTKGAFTDDYKRYTGNDIDVAEVPKIYSVFDPTIDAEFFKGEAGEEYYNLFQRTELMSYFKECEPRAEIPYHINQLLTHVFPDEEQRTLFLHNLAFHLRHLVGSASFIMSGTAGGTGKGVLYNQILSLIYGEYYIKVETDTFSGSFNGELKNKLVIFGNEIDEANPNAPQKVYTKIKNIVGEDTVAIHSKGVEKATHNNYAFVVLATNEARPFRVDGDNDNRRINFFPTKDSKIKDAYEDWPAGKKAIDSFIAQEIYQFMEYLAYIETDASLYDKHIETDLFRNLVSKSTPSTAKIAHAMLSKDLVTLEEECEDDFVEFYRSEIIDRNISYITVSKLKDFFPKQRKQITDYFRIKGVDVSPHNIPREKRTTSACIINPEGTKLEELQLKEEPKL